MESEGDRGERIRSEQEAAASEDLEAIRALAAAADGDSAIEAEAADESTERHVTSATAMDTTTEGGIAGPDTKGDSPADASSADKGVGVSKSAEQATGGTKKRPPESGGATLAEDEARHGHSHHHEWLAERHAHTRVGTDFQVTALPTPHPHHAPTGAVGNGANGSGGDGARLDHVKKDTGLEGKE